MTPAADMTRTIKRRPSTTVVAARVAWRALASTCRGLVYWWPVTLSVLSWPLWACLFATAVVAPVVVSVVLGVVAAMASFVVVLYVGELIVAGARALTRIWREESNRET